MGTSTVFTIVIQFRKFSIRIRLIFHRNKFVEFSEIIRYCRNHAFWFSITSKFFNCFAACSESRQIFKALFKFKSVSLKRFSRPSFFSFTTRTLSGSNSYFGILILQQEDCIFNLVKKSLNTSLSFFFLIALN